jgi:hypothetical protein
MIAVAVIEHHFHPVLNKRVHYDHGWLSDEYCQPMTIFGWVALECGGLKYFQPYENKRL